MSNDRKSNDDGTLLMSSAGQGGEPPEALERAEWWEASLTRRPVGALALGAATVVALEGCCDDDLSDLEEHDALELQQKEGWDVGDEGQTLSFEGDQLRDSLGGEGWKAYLDPVKLQDVTRPATAGWRPLERAVLFQAVSQDSLNKQLRPVYTPAMGEVYARGKALVSLVSSVKDKEATLLLLDLPGPQSVALAASMAESVEPVFYFDNWPHPQGVVKSHETLGAAIYYAEELKQKAAARQGRAMPVAMVLDSRRLSPYQDASDAFDNRYLVDLPDATALKKLGIARVLYITEKPVEDEMDDLNEALVALSENRIKVASLSMDAFQKDTQAPEEASASTGGYFYGGGYNHHPHFFSYYPMFLFFPFPGSRWSTSPSAPPASAAARPTWQPRTRPTAFSGMTRGARAGVGRSKPVGFGRVSTRTDGAGRPMRVSPASSTRTGSSPSRSGSFGRSRGGFGG